MAAGVTPLRVALVSTAALDQPGSMRAYADTLLDALRRHAPGIQAQLLELDPLPARNAWRRRVRSLVLPVYAWLRRRPAPDLWHLLDGSRAYVASGLSGAPVVVTAHDVIPWLQSRGQFAGAPATGMASRWLWRRNGRAMQNAARLICDSERTCADVRSAFPIGAHRCDVVALPLRPELAALAARPSTAAREAGLVLHVGHNGFYKNREQVLRIFARLDRSLARQLMMIGPPPTAALRELAQRLAIAERIEWLGDVDDGQLAERYRRASVLLFPSLYEGFGWPVLEAMAFGLPVVCSDAGSLPEVAGEVAPCVAVDDVDGFVVHVEALLRDEAFAAKASAAAQARAAQFSTERFASQMEVAYRLAFSANTAIIDR